MDKMVQTNFLKEMISKWGNKEGQCIELLKAEGYPLPEYLNDTKHDTFTLVLSHPIVGVTEQVTEQVVNMMDRRALVHSPSLTFYRL